MHPLFVHFPIGLLVVYGLMELVPARFVRKFTWWHGTKLFLLTLGMIAVIPTAMTGDIDSQLPQRQAAHHIVEKHELFAGMTISFFGLLFGAHVLQIIKGNAKWNGKFMKLRLVSSVLPLLIWLSNMVLRTPIKQMIVVAGLMAITITGGLGASIVFGPDVDPIVKFIYALVVGQ